MMKLVAWLFVANAGDDLLEGASCSMQRAPVSAASACVDGFDTYIRFTFFYSVKSPCGPLRSLLNINFTVRLSLAGVRPNPMPVSIEIGLLV